MTNSGVLGAKVNFRTFMQGGTGAKKKKKKKTNANENHSHLGLNANENHSHLEGKKIWGYAVNLILRVAKFY